MKKKNVFFCAVAFLACTLVAGCSNILTYIRHDEGRNITCDSQKGIKRDSNCNIEPVR